MGKKYRQVEFSIGDSLENAVNELLEYKSKGILACGEFNGKTLYSDTVTMDSVYMNIIGKTKSEFDESQRKWREDIARREREFKESIPSLIEEWKKKGREVLTEDKWNRWDKIVPIRLNDLYHGMELGNCLDIAKKLNNNGTFEEAKVALENQGHSGMSYGLVCSMVREFCSRGEEFVEYANGGMKNE